MIETTEIFGFPVIITDLLPDELVRRSWRERLFTRPWRPRQKFRRVRNRSIYLAGGRHGKQLMMTARTLERIRQQFVLIDEEIKL